MDINLKTLKIKNIKQLYKQNKRYMYATNCIY